MHYPLKTNHLEGHVNVIHFELDVIQVCQPPMHISFFFRRISPVPTKTSECTDCRGWLPIQELGLSNWHHSVNVCLTRPNHSLLMQIKFDSLSAEFQSKNQTGKDEAKYLINCSAWWLKGYFSYCCLRAHLNRPIHETTQSAWLHQGAVQSAPSWRWAFVLAWIFQACVGQDSVRSYSNISNGVYVRVHL